MQRHGTGIAPITQDFIPYDEELAEQFNGLDPNQAWPHGVDMDMVLGKKEVPRKYTLMVSRVKTDMIWADTILQTDTI